MRTITVGRDNSCDIVINNQRISRIHAQISQGPNGYIYRDSSSNGTRINGIVLNRGGERIVMPGDSVLLADTEALPWHKVQAILPLDGGGSDDNIMYKTGTTMIVFGYICAILFPLIGLILGLILANSTQMTPRGRMKTYMPSAITNGWVIFSLACLVMIVNFILVINLFNYY